MASGIDLKGMDDVISYDVPTYAKTYIHRVGRNARAGKEGVAVSLCEEKQVKNFLKMVKDAGIEGVHELRISDEKLEFWGVKFTECLEVVTNVLQKGKEGKEKKKWGKSGQHFEGKLTILYYS